jgi:glycosyltransferase involved in cell wall biosynthesis
MIARSDLYYPGAPAAFLSALRRIDSDVLHLHVGGDVTTRVLMMALACTILGTGDPILTLHSGGYSSSAEGQNARPSSLAGFVFRRFKKIIAVNEDLVQVLRRFGVPPERIEVILPFALKPPPEETEIPASIRGFCDAHTPVLVSVGGWEKDYEPGLQIDAFAEVKREFPNAGLLMIGGGSMKHEVEAMVERSDAAHSIRLAGPVDHDIVLHLIKIADAMLRVTLFDGDAISVREGLFLGTPVIATDNNMRPPGVELIPRGDRAELVAAVRRVVERGKPPAREQSPDNSNIKRVVDLYEELAGQRG